MSESDEDQPIARRTRGASRYYQCVKCNRGTSVLNPFDDNEYLCRPCCMRITITATNAKKQYRLKETDLENMNAWQFSTRYHTCVRRFNIDDVKAAAMCLYGTSNEQEIEQIYQARRTNVGSMPDFPDGFEELWAKLKSPTELHGKKSAFKRYKEVVDKFPDAFTGADYSPILNTLENWIVRGLQEYGHRVNRFLELKEEFDTGNWGPELTLANMRLEHRAMYDSCLSGTAEVRIYVQRCRDISVRKSELLAALNERGVPFREDSVLCRYYINGDSRAKSLEQTVTIMENMKFLHEHTNYARVYKEILDDAYWQRRRDRYYDSDDSFDTGDTIDREELSVRAQRKVMAAYKGPVDIVPVGLRTWLSPNKKNLKINKIVHE